MTHNKGGRPRKEAHEKRNKRVSVNFTEAEYNRATEKAERLKMSLTEFLRQSAEGAEFKEADEMKIVRVKFLGSISNNINQMAKRVNRGSVNEEDLLKIFEWIKTVITEIREDVLR